MTIVQLDFIVGHATMHLMHEADDEINTHRGRKLMKKTAKLAILAFCILILFSSSGCITHPLSLREPGEVLPAGQSVNKLVDEWSRHSQVHKRWATVLDVNAVFLSWELRSAIAEQTITVRNIKEPTASAIRERVRDLHTGYVTFYLVVFTTLPEWNNFDSEDAVWTVTFTSDRQKGIPAFRIEPADMEPAMQYAFFTDHTKWQKVYRISFLKRIDEAGGLLIDEMTSWFGLHFDSYLGSTEIKWQLKNERHDRES